MSYDKFFGNFNRFLPKKCLKRHFGSFLGGRVIPLSLKPLNYFGGSTVWGVPPSLTREVSAPPHITGPHVGCYVLRHGKFGDRATIIVVDALHVKATLCPGLALTLPPSLLLLPALGPESDGWFPPTAASALFCACPRRVRCSDDNPNLAAPFAAAVRPVGALPPPIFQLFFSGPFNPRCLRALCLRAILEGRS